MTRSEKLEQAIRSEQTYIWHGQVTGSNNKLCAQEKERHEFLLSVLLADKKRSEGCLYCNGNMLDGYALENMYGESQRIINLAMKNHRSGDQLPISFCPNCGRSLTGGESV